MQSKRTIKTSEFAFADLIKAKAVYFDQSRLVKQILSANIGPLVLEWPSGFGKSLTLSMLHAYTDKFADPTLFDDLKLKEEDKEFFEKYHNKYFDIYLDFANIDARNENEFNQQLFQVLRDAVLAAKTKLEKWKGKSVEIDEMYDTLLKLFENNDAEIDGVALDWVMNDLCSWLTKQEGIDPGCLNIYVDNFDAPMRHAMARGDLKFCDEMCGRIDDFFTFVKSSDWLHNRIFMAGHHYIPMTHQVFSSFHNILHNENSAEGLFAFGISENEVDVICEAKNSAASAQEIKASCAWYLTPKGKVTRPDMLLRGLGKPVAADNPISSRCVLQGVINSLNADEVSGVYHALNNLDEFMVLNRTFEIWKKEKDVNLWFLSILRMTGYLTAAHAALPHEHFFRRIELAFTSKQLKVDLREMLQTRWQAFQPTAVQQAAFFHRDNSGKIAVLNFEKPHEIRNGGVTK